MLPRDMTNPLLSAPRAIDITGQAFGRLTAVRPLYAKPHKGIFWLCRCSCGNTTIAIGTKLRNGHRISCGCAKQLHGHAGNHSDKKMSPTYSSWRSMIARCTQPSNPAFEYYQKRGIAVCDHWRSFENFLADVGERPSKKHSLDRYPNNDGNYEPGNCRWATKQEQANNRITNTYFSYRGQRYTLAELARATGASKETLRARLVRPGGWVVDDAVETPTIPRHLRKAGLSKRTAA